MSALLAHSIGPGNAAVMLLTGDPIDAATALRWGLVSEVLPPEDLPAGAAELAATIASRAPIAAQTAKRNLRAAFEMPLGRAIDYERHLQTICFATEDAAEGRAAFADAATGVPGRKCSGHAGKVRPRRSAPASSGPVPELGDRWASCPATGSSTCPSRWPARWRRCASATWAPT